MTCEIYITSSTMVSTMQKVKKKRPSLFFAMMIKKIKLGSESVKSIIVPNISEGMKIAAMPFATSRGPIVKSVSRFVFFFV